MESKDKLYQRYLAVPESGHGQGILVLHAWWGLNDFFRNFCDRLAQVGFVALAPDLFGGEVADTIQEAEQHKDHWDEEHEAPAIILQALQELKQLPAVTGNGLSVIGFSMGAYWSLWLAEQKPELIQKVVLFYGTNGGGGDFSQSQASFQGHFAENDPYEPPEAIQGLEKNLKRAGRFVNFYVYPGTGHWFFEQDRPDAYEPQAAQLAWERTISFLHKGLESDTKQVI